MRRNLLRNPSAREGLANIEALNGAIIEDATDFSFYGQHAFKVIKGAGNFSGFRFVDLVQVTAGLPYALSAYVGVPDTIPAQENANLVARVTWLNGLGAEVGRDQTGVATVSGDGSWVRLTSVTSAPVGAVYAYVSVAQLVGGTAGQVFYVDAVMFEQSNYVSGFIDNRTQDYENTIVNRALTPYQSHVLQGMQLNADVALGGLILNTIDENDTLWVCTDIEGWWGNADPELPDIPRGTEDGSYEVTGRYTARQLSLSGVFIPPHPDALSEARDRLVSAVNLVRRGEWLRTNEAPTRAGYVRLSGRPMMVTTNARGRTEFQIGLRAADPIKYHWNDADNDGLTYVRIDGDDGTGIARNIGTADVTAIFEIRGPSGAGTTIYNNLTNETLTVIPALRGKLAVATVTNREIFDNVVTLTTSAPHKMVVGDRITVTGLGAPYDTAAAGEYETVIAASSTFPYTVSYERVTADRPSEARTGGISLFEEDVLEVDTYEKSVRFNGSTIGQRSKVETLVDWIKLAPGDNTIQFNDNIDDVHVTTKAISGGVATMTTSEAHHLVPGESVQIAFAEEATLARKESTNGTVKMTTTADHGFSIGDNVDVVSTDTYSVTNKALTSNQATLTVAVPQGSSFAFANGDRITVDLPVTRTLSEKSASGTTVTLKTSVAHGYSAGDSVTVALPSTANITNKSLTNSVATITTAAAHDYSTGDVVTVTMPTTTTVTSKYISGTVAGSSIILTTSTPHNFSPGDSVVVAFPTSATPTGTRSYSGSGGASPYQVTINTTLAHGFSPGDRITVNLGTGVSDPLAASYNGSKVIETVPSTTSFTYTMYAQDAAASSTSWGTGATVTNETNIMINGTRSANVPSANQLMYTI